MDGGVEVVDGDAGRRRHQGVPVVRIDAVEAQQDVEVHRAPALHLGDLTVGHPHRRHPADSAGVGDDLDVGDAASATQGGELAFDGLFRAPPQFAGGVVPDGLVVVVVAVQAERSTELRIVGVVAGEAGCGLSVWAGAGGAPGAAGCGTAVTAPPVGAGVSGDVPVVHRAEGRRGEGGEDDRVRADGGGDGLAAGQAAADDLEGVTGVDPGAVGALGGTAVPARLVERPVGQLVGVLLGQDPAGAGLDGGEGAGQADRAGAATGGAGVLQPAEVVRGCGAVQGLGVTAGGEGGHGFSSRGGRGRTTNCHRTPERCPSVVFVVSPGTAGEGGSRPRAGLAIGPCAAVELGSCVLGDAGRGGVPGRRLPVVAAGDPHPSRFANPKAVVDGGKAVLGRSADSGSAQWPVRSRAGGT
ncbi:hypothetical protein TPA0907_58250 [Micromonospora humidisoli]|nr:hypothetical protein TPA0907_58250 [Micromonospora sp. AKA109]